MSESPPDLSRFSPGQFNAIVIIVTERFFPFPSREHLTNFCELSVPHFRLRRYVWKQCHNRYRQRCRQLRHEPKRGIPSEFRYSARNSMARRRHFADLDVTIEWVRFAARGSRWPDRLQVENHFRRFNETFSRTISIASGCPRC